MLTVFKDSPAGNGVKYAGQGAGSKTVVILSYLKQKSLAFARLSFLDVIPLGTNIKISFSAVILDFTGILKNLLQYS